MCGLVLIGFPPTPVDSVSGPQGTEFNCFGIKSGNIFLSAPESNNAVTGGSIIPLAGFIILIGTNGLKQPSLLVKGYGNLAN